MPSSLVSFIVRFIRSLQGGEQLSQEELVAVVPLVDRVFQSYYHLGLAILLNAHDHVWNDDNNKVFSSKYGKELPEIRLEVSNLLFKLSCESIFHEMEKIK